MGTPQENSMGFDMVGLGVMQRVDLNFAPSENPVNQVVQVEQTGASVHVNGTREPVRREYEHVRPQDEPVRPQSEQVRLQHEPVRQEREQVSLQHQPVWQVSGTGNERADSHARVGQEGGQVNNSHEQIWRGENEQENDVQERNVEDEQAVEERNVEHEHAVDERSVEHEQAAEKRNIDHEQAFEVSLPRNLSSPDRAIRERALTVLGHWLCSCKQVDEDQLVTVWKSLLFRVWHTSRGPAQVELSKSIALTVGSLTPDLALVTFKVFLSIMAKEWSGIDKNRIEKFRLLLQLCLREMFRLLENQSWNEDLTRKFVEAIGTQGVNVFLVHAYLEELRSFVPPTPETLRMLLEPFILLSVNSTNKVVLQKVRDTVFLPLLQEARAALRSKSESEDGEQQDKSLGSLVLALSMAGKFSELSASPSVAPSNKKLLQQLYEDFSNSEKPLLALRPLKKTKPEPVELPPSSSADMEVSVTGRKRKRVNAGEAVVEHRRVLRSEKRLLDQQQQQEQMEWDPEGDPVVLNLEERLTQASDDENRHETSEKTVVNEEIESEAEQQQPAAKRVRFSLRNNIVWTPHRPLPPQWVRVPPCAAPRGSAMKAGVEPGPIASPRRSNEEKTMTGRRKRKKVVKGRGKNSKSNKNNKENNNNKRGKAAAAASPRKSKRLNSP